MTDSQLNTSIIGIGSNINAGENIPNMFHLLMKHVEIISISSFTSTRPIGITEQPDYTNGAVKIRTALSKTELTKVLKIIEDDLGRDRTAPRYGPRTIDLDIIVWNGKVVDPDYYSRDFLRNSVGELF